MKILISGATGFVGSHLVSHLLEASHTVTGFRRGMNSYGMRRTESWFDRVNWLVGDLADGCSGACDRQDAVFHLAAKSFVDHSIRDPSVFVPIRGRSVWS